jgi:hypothetical protein
VTREDWRENLRRVPARGPVDENQKSAQRSNNLHGRTHHDLACEKSAKTDGTLNKTETQKLKAAKNTFISGESTKVKISSTHKIKN